MPWSVSSRWHINGPCPPAARVWELIAGNAMLEAATEPILRAAGSAPRSGRAPEAGPQSGRRGSGVRASHPEVPSAFPATPHNDGHVDDRDVQFVEGWPGVAVAEGLRIAYYLHLTSLKGVSSMKLHRDLGVTQKTAWFMLQRIRKAFESDDDEPPFSGPVEVDEVYFGGLRKNMHKDKREELDGRGTVGKEIVVGVKDRETNTVRARHVQSADTASLAGFAASNT